MYWSNKNYSNKNCPGQCGSVGWASSCKPKSHGFNSQSGHMPRLQVWFLVGVHTRSNQSMFFFSPFSSPFPHSKKKNNDDEGEWKMFIRCLFLVWIPCYTLSKGNQHNSYCQARYDKGLHRGVVMGLRI